MLINIKALLILVGVNGHTYFKSMTELPNAFSFPNFLYILFILIYIVVSLNLWFLSNLGETSSRSRQHLYPCSENLCAT